MAATSKKRKGPVANGIELVVTVAIAIGLALLIQAFLVKPYRIPSGSMIPTLAIGQRILVNRLDTSPGVGSIVVFHPPAGADPVDPVCGNPSQGSGKTQPCNAPTPAESKQTFVKRVVGLPGDHLRIVDGKVWRNGVKETGSYVQSCPDGADCTFPKSITVPAGHYYMMGDNRDESDDSRFWGPVPKNWLIGVAFATYWPLNRLGIF
jgi:signal peptidase I